jgi:hypothetical protein
VIQFSALYRQRLQVLLWYRKYSTPIAGCNRYKMHAANDRNAI